MTKRSPRRERTLPRQRRSTRWVATALGLAVVGLGAWLLTADASPLRASGNASAATLASYRPADLHALVVSPTDANTVTFGHHYGMLVSHDGGATGTPLSGASGK